MPNVAGRIWNGKLVHRQRRVAQRAGRSPRTTLGPRRPWRACDSNGRYCSDHRCSGPDLIVGRAAIRATARAIHKKSVADARRARVEIVPKEIAVQTWALSYRGSLCLQLLCFCTTSSNHNATIVLSCRSLRSHLKSVINSDCVARACETATLR